jgi:hypothetical protein
MKKLAADAYRHSESWQCIRCHVQISPEGKTLEEFTDACVNHAKSH